MNQYPSEMSKRWVALSLLLRVWSIWNHVFANMYHQKYMRYFFTWNIIGAQQSSYQTSTGKLIVLETVGDINLGLSHLVCHQLLTINFRFYLLDRWHALHWIIKLTMPPYKKNVLNLLHMGKLNIYFGNPIFSLLCAIISCCSCLKCFPNLQILIHF